LRGQRLRMSPPIMALAMLPPPMKVMFMEPYLTAKTPRRQEKHECQK
jgi:hypothetical protein